MKASRSHWFRVIAIALVLTMICHDVTWANQAALSSGGIPSAFPKAAGTAYLPQEIGRVDEIATHQKSKTSAVLVYHIQDAHSIYEAQSNLAKILERLIQQEGVSLVLVEGGSGKVSLSPLRKTAWKSVRRQVAEEFLRKGKISGEEYLQVASDYPFELIGIEDEALYQANLKVYLRALRRKPEVLRRLSQIESRIRGLQSELYPSWCYPLYWAT
ncbi:MAG: hypothetical protein Q8R76_13110 [Candidatus Omnitrophota bacterium]|nr:hypothetical protein [Candidatus Omnitrophota bacterium]